MLDSLSHREKKPRSARQFVHVISSQIMHDMCSAFKSFFQLVFCLSWHHHVCFCRISDLISSQSLEVFPLFTWVHVTKDKIQQTSMAENTELQSFLDKRQAALTKCFETGNVDETIKYYDPRDRDFSDHGTSPSPFLLPPFPGPSSHSYPAA